MYYKKVYQLVGDIGFLKCLRPKRLLESEFADHIMRKRKKQRNSRTLSKCDGQSPGSIPRRYFALVEGE